jgi:hypothetical protein
MDMIDLKLLHQFTTPFIAAASGLVLRDDHFFIVSDDELTLYAFDKKNYQSTLSVKLFPGELPSNAQERKKLKPDLESLVNIPSGILCIPSGSKRQRQRAAIFQDGQIIPLSMQRLYTELEREFPELNIEGAIHIGNELRLFQRGNGKQVRNATIDVDLDSLLEGAPIWGNVQNFNLGAINDVPYTFTDATITDRNIWFLAVAEDTDDPYLDGVVLGSILGKMDYAGNIIEFQKLNLSSKPEGLCIERDHFFVVTDDDDRSKPSGLYMGKLF